MKTKDTMKLPTIVVNVKQLKNPCWGPVRLEDGSIDPTGYYVDSEIEAEILTLNLSTRSMRIRFVWMGKVDTRDISMPDNMFVTVHEG